MTDGEMLVADVVRAERRAGSECMDRAAFEKRLDALKGEYIRASHNLTSRRDRTRIALMVSDALRRSSLEGFDLTACSAWSAYVERELFDRLGELKLRCDYWPPTDDMTPAEQEQRGVWKIAHECFSIGKPSRFVSEILRRLSDAREGKSARRTGKLGKRAVGRRLLRGV